MASIEEPAPVAGTIRLVFARDEPLTLEALQIMFDRHRDAIELLEQSHDARTTVLAGDAPTVELSLVIEDAGRGRPASELEALAAAHDLEICLAGDGFALRQLRHAA
jgi:hypothetical protein